MSKHTETFRKCLVFPLLARDVPRPLFCSVFGTSQSGIVEKCTFLKTFKNQGQKQNCIFDIFALVFWGPETPIFIVFSRPQKGGVQVSSLEVTKMGFNYAPVSIYIYIYMPDDCWGDCVSKNGPVRGSPQSRFGDHAFSHYEKRHFRGKVWSQEKRPKTTNCTPNGPRGLFRRNTHLNLCTGQLGAKPLRQGVALIKIAT